MAQDLDEIHTLPNFSKPFASHNKGYSCWICWDRYSREIHHEKVKTSFSRSIKGVAKSDRVSMGLLHINQQPPNRSRVNSTCMETERGEFFEKDIWNLIVNLSIDLVSLPASDGQPPPPMDLIPWQPHPRVPVTASMLCSYSYMRGRMGQNSDPLYYSLYPAPARHFRHNVLLPPITNRKSMEE
jgi:hypothetical protein